MAGMSDSFYLRRSVLEISGTEVAKKDVTGDAVIVTNVTVKSIPREDTSTRYAIGGKRKFTSSTRINLTKVENTDLIKSVGSETTDTTKASIEQAGGLIVKLISLASIFGAASDTPCIREKDGKKTFDLDLSKERQEFDAGRPSCIEISYGPVPKDTIPADDLPVGSDTRYYYYAACRDATVSIAQTAQQTITETIKISDPRFLQFVQFPVKGKIDHHSSCGISVVTEASPATNPADIVGALEAQGKAIKEAIEAAKAD